MSSSTVVPDIGQSLAADAGAYWSSSADRRWVRDMSHWRGQGRWADDGAWTGIGRAHVAMVDAFFGQVGRTRPIRRMLEWGTGGGANAVAFAQRVQTIYGVDISAANLGECGRQLESGGFAGWRPIHIDAARPADVLNAVDGPLDFILSTAVFQHFPGQAYGLEVLGVMHELLAPGGLAIVQTRYDDGSAELRTKDRDYAQNVITFTSYKIEAFWDAATAAGLRPVSIVLQPEPRYAYYWLCKD
jgi:cyclopropane fatty-acyl-phospholipid synthase-like methyltransferase